MSASSGPVAGSEPCNDGPCNEAKGHLWDYLDGELTGGDCDRIKSHIKECPPCDELFRNEQKVKDAVSRACGCEQAPPDLQNRITAMVGRLRSEACGGTSDSTISSQSDSSAG